MHLGGKIEVVSKAPLKTAPIFQWPTHSRRRAHLRRDFQKPENVYTLTIKKNTVAVVTDGTAVLGLGDIGPAAAYR